jgi:hypothetical protein
MKNLLTSELLAKSDGRHPSILSNVDCRIVLLTLLNGFLYWPWHWLRVAFDAGDRHPQLVLTMLVVTFAAWGLLLAAVLHRINNRQSK